MTVDLLLERVRELGGRAEARGDRLHLEAPAPLPAELVAELRRHKPEIMRALAAPCPTCGSGPGVLLCRACGTGTAPARRFAETLPPEVRQEPPSSAGPPIYHRPPFELRCERCRELAAKGIVVLGCSRCDIRRGGPAGSHGGPTEAA